MTLEQILVGALLDSLLSITKGKRRASVVAMDEKFNRRRSLVSAHGSVLSLNTTLDGTNEHESILSRGDNRGSRLGIVDEEDEEIRRGHHAPRSWSCERLSL